MVGSSTAASSSHWEQNRSLERAEQRVLLPDGGTLTLEQYEACFPKHVYAEEPDDLDSGPRSPTAIDDFLSADQDERQKRSENQLLTAEIQTEEEAYATRNDTIRQSVWGNRTAQQTAKFFYRKCRADLVHEPGKLGSSNMLYYVSINGVQVGHCKECAEKLVFVMQRPPVTRPLHVHALCSSTSSIQV